MPKKTDHKIRREILAKVEAVRHTPGPWGNNKWNCHEHQISALGSTVALVSHSSAVISEESADANARLIAAAPDLLEALFRLLDCPDVQMDDTEPETDAAIQQANAAIAKVEGRE